MQEEQNPVCDVANAVCDGFRRLGDISYAILPRDVAHTLADLKKAVLTELRGCLDWQIGWIDERVAGGDRLREEWRAKCRRQTTVDTTPGTAV
jgi:hypothetical protein